MSAHYVPYEAAPGCWEFSTPVDARAGFKTEADAKVRAAEVEKHDRMLADAAAQGLRKGKGPHARRLMAYFQQEAQEVAS